MFESNFPVDRLSCSYTVLWNQFKKLAKGFSPRTRQVLPTDAVSPLFQAALEATEEAVYNALFQATTVTSKCGTAQAIPIDRVRELLAK
jgi:L-aminopeptidase/D-esterase-like protein